MSGKPGQSVEMETVGGYPSVASGRERWRLRGGWLEGSGSAVKELEMLCYRYRLGCNPDSWQRLKLDCDSAHLMCTIVRLRLRRRYRELEV